MKFRIEIASDDQACADQPRSEVIAALSAIAEKISGGSFGGIIRDTNGNRIGDWSLDDEREAEG